MGTKEFSDTLGVCLNALLPLIPSGRTHFTMCLEELEGIDHPYQFIHVAP